MQNFSYHTHTDFSDGINTLDEMLAQAVRLGWKEIGISDHLMVHKNFKKSIVWPLIESTGKPEIYYQGFDEILHLYQQHSQKIRETAEKYPIKVYVGYEVDFFNYTGWLAEFKDFIKQVDHDYLVSGNHFFMSEDGLAVTDIYLYEKSEEADNEKIFEAYLRHHYQVVGEAVKSGLFSFLAHLDYARRSKLHANFPMMEERLFVAKALKETNTPCEVSTKGLRRIGDFYPEEPILKELIKQNIPLLISDDAHRIEELGMGFDKAEERLKSLGSKNRWHLK